MHILSTGEATRLGSTGASAPDLTVGPARLAGATWRALPDVGGSDHTPILVDVPMAHPPVRPQRQRERWAWPKADWSKYRNTTEEKLMDFEKSSTKATPTEKNQELTRTLLSAANAAVPKGRGRPSPKAWWSNDVEQAVKRRAEARRTARRTQSKEDLAKWFRLRGET
eukprot:gene19194-biopygen22576